MLVWPYEGLVRPHVVLVGPPLVLVGPPLAILGVGRIQSMSGDVSGCVTSVGDQKQESWPKTSAYCKKVKKKFC